VPARSQFSRRLAIVLVCLCSLVVCCALAWWQWERFSSANGTFQNLGYVLQWPLFGLFPAFMFWRIRRLGRRAAKEVAEPAPGSPAGREQAPAEPPAPRPRPRPSAVPPDADEDPELAAYNRYLAELNARDRPNPR
jgi:hypothetical protein